MKRQQAIPDGITLTKEHEVPLWVLTGYRVHRGTKFLGYVWSREGHSYRGSQGWNRGIRLTDFYPTEWKYGAHLGHEGDIAYSRRMAIERLIESQAREQ